MKVRYKARKEIASTGAWFHYFGHSSIWHCETGPGTSSAGVVKYWLGDVEIWRVP